MQREISKQMENRSAIDTTHEEACARVASLFPQLWLRLYVESKLRTDPVFGLAYDLLGNSPQPILDLGCGLGLLGFYLRERGLEQPITGLEVDGRKVRYARKAADGRYHRIHFDEQDMRAGLPAFCGNVVLFDVLHYLEPAAQTSLLAQIAPRVAPEGMLLLRDCPRDGSPRFWATYGGEVFAQAISWNINTSLHFPRRDSIVGEFSAGQFTIEEKPTWGRGPFNNRLYIFRRRAYRSAVARL